MPEKKESKEKVKEKVLAIKAESIDNPESQAAIMERAERYRKKHGTLTEKDLLTVMTV